jgi:hypothetical protein
MKEHDVFFFFFLGDVFELVKSIFHLAETDVSIVEIIAPCDQPWLLDLPIINRCELILLFFFFSFFLWLQTHTYICNFCYNIGRKIYFL